MGGGPENGGAPQAWIDALQADARARAANLELPPFLQRLVPLLVQRPNLVTPFYASQQPTLTLSVAEVAEEYYEQCFGTPLTPQQRAHKLLFEHLTESEQKQWTDYKVLTVIAKSGKQYRVDATNVGRVDDGHTFCIVVGNDYGYGIPTEDRILALKLLIETNEEEFLKTAVDRGAPRAFGQDEGRVPTTAEIRAMNQQAMLNHQMIQNHRMHGPEVYEQIHPELAPLWFRVFDATVLIVAFVIGLGILRYAAR